ncbi:hypothetical protein SALBM311S_07436 [Streptomyces alboniger]
MSPVAETATGTVPGPGPGPGQVKAAVAGMAKGPVTVAGKGRIPRVADMATHTVTVTVTVRLPPSLSTCARSSPPS